MSDAVSIGRRFFEELLGKGDASVADEILADNIVMYHPSSPTPVSYTHLRAHETVLDLVCRLLLEKKKKHRPHPT